MTTHDSTPVAPTVWPTLRSTDARRLVDFLVTAFGFSETVVHLDGERVAHAELAWPEGGGVMLGSVRPGGDDPWPQPPGAAGVYVVTADVRAVHDRAVSAGAEVLRPPADSGYGSTETTLRDCDGNLWSFGTYPGEPRRTS